MAIGLQQLIGEAQTLSPQEQVELISAVSQFLRQSYQQPLSTNDFWQPQSISQLIQAQVVMPVRDIMQLAFDEAADDESADEMIAYIYGQRQADRSSTA
ncbi:MAG: hypothetical protein JOZ51_00730 [Chloroflexi bacterium]|nr:hypothetical protein [Chloroflexota bacterium]